SHERERIQKKKSTSRRATHSAERKKKQLEEQEKTIENAHEALKRREAHLKGLEQVLILVDMKSELMTKQKKMDEDMKDLQTQKEALTRGVEELKMKEAIEKQKEEEVDNAREVILKEYQSYQRNQAKFAKERQQFEEYVKQKNDEFALQTQQLNAKWLSLHELEERLEKKEMELKTMQELIKQKERDCELKWTSSVNRKEQELLTMQKNKGAMGDGQVENGNTWKVGLLEQQYKDILEKNNEVLCKQQLDTHMMECKRLRQELDFEKQKLDSEKKDLWNSTNWFKNYCFCCSSLLALFVDWLIILLSYIDVVCCWIVSFLFSFLFQYLIVDIFKKNSKEWKTQKQKTEKVFATFQQERDKWKSLKKENEQKLRAENEQAQSCTRTIKTQLHSLKKKIKETELCHQTISQQVHSKKKELQKLHELQASQQRQDQKNADQFASLRLSLTIFCKKKFCFVCGSFLTQGSDETKKEADKSLMEQWQKLLTKEFSLNNVFEKQESALKSSAYFRSFDLENDNMKSRENACGSSLRYSLAVLNESDIVAVSSGTT
ncbi:LIM-type zinc finger-containing protein, partial [Reticulomyxa filosa]